MKKSQLRQIIKEEIRRAINEEPIGKLQMSQIREISGLEDFLWFKHTLDSKTIRRASMEEQKEWSQVTKELDDVLNHWVRLLLELNKKYPS